MGILKGREEFIPVTCAVLKDADRDAFFGQIRKNRAGTPEELARWLDVPVSLVQDWMNGRSHIPFHTLQNIAYQFSVELPPVGELRRESMPAGQLPQVRPPEPPAPPPSQRQREPRPQREREPRPPREPRRQQRQKTHPSQQQQQRPPKQPKPQQQQQQQQQQPQRQGRWPKLSDALAYWVGLLYAGGRVQGEELSFPGIAGAVWARKTQELFAVAPDPESGACRIEGFPEFAARSCPGGGGSGETALPRWIWSNPAWKTACLKAVADATARFDPAEPSLSLASPATIQRSVHKLLNSVGFKAHAGREGVLAISGREELDRYFRTIGTDNHQLRDQWDAFCGSGAVATVPAAAPEAPAPATDAAAQAPKKRAPRPKRTLYRGRPGA